MRMYAENILHIDDISEELNFLFKDDICMCEKIEFEINTQADEQLINSLLDKIFNQMKSQAKEKSCIKYHKNQEIAKNICEYRIKIFYDTTKG